jgi:prephenate dehydrogenase
MSAPTVLISSLGLMGGSLAAALTRAGWRVLLHHRRPEVALRGQELGYGKAVEDLAASLAHTDLVVVCSPVGVITDQVRSMAALHPRPVFTDVGSIKGSICQALADLAKAGRFVGSHPMAGSHLQGIEHARADLYHDCMTAITPIDSTPAEVIALIERLWRSVGARVCRFTPEEHDRAVVEASHLPHVMASATAAQLTATGATLAATGFRDTTRVAAGSTDLWADILLHNRSAVQRGLAAVHEHLARLERALLAGDEIAVRNWLEDGKAGRSRFDSKSLADIPTLTEEA